MSITGSLTICNADGSDRARGVDRGAGRHGFAMRYPNALVACTRYPGSERLAPDARIVFEVLSGDQGRRDRIEKVREQAAVASIRRHSIAESASAVLVPHRLRADEAWTVFTLTREDTPILPEIGARFRLRSFTRAWNSRMPPRWGEAIPFPGLTLRRGDNCSIVSIGSCVGFSASVASMRDFGIRAPAFSGGASGAHPDREGDGHVRRKMFGPRVQPSAANRGGAHLVAAALISRRWPARRPAILSWGQGLPQLPPPSLPSGAGVSWRV
jgi:hypothetical protein